MSTLPAKTALITGADAGIGKDVARQLALRPEMARIYLASAGLTEVATLSSASSPSTSACSRSQSGLTGGGDL